MIFAQLNDGACKTYLIASEATKEAILVDPVLDGVPDYEQELLKRALTLKLVIDTHVHADHVSGAALLRKHTGAQYLMHERSVATALDRRLRDGEHLVVGGVDLEVLHTPGHTQDSVTLKLADRLLTGDFLFIGEGGAGRTDLPGGDPGEHWASLQRLAGLPDELAVFPGHDYHQRASSTLGEERRKNPRLEPRTREAYTRWLDSQVLGPADWMKDVIAANYACVTSAHGLHIPGEKPACEVGGTQGDKTAEPVKVVSALDVAKQLAHGNHPLLIDVREPDEFRRGHLPGARLVPLGELHARLHELEPMRHRHVVVVCASGGRASTATGILSAAGFTDVASMTGGIQAWNQLRLPLETDG